MHIRPLSKVSFAPLGVVEGTRYMGYVSLPEMSAANSFRFYIAKKKRSIALKSELTVINRIS